LTFVKAVCPREHAARALNSIAAPVALTGRARRQE
jgi:hypothetical protein